MENIEIIWKPMFEKLLARKESEIIFLSQKIDGMGGDTWHRDD